LGKVQSHPAEANILFQ